MNKRFSITDVTLIVKWCSRGFFFFSGHSHLIFLCLFTHALCHNWLPRCQWSLDAFLVFLWVFFFFFFNSLFDYSMSTWKTGCVSARLCLSWNAAIWSALVSHGPSQRDEAAPLLLSAFTQHVFSLSFVLPICERHLGTVPKGQWQGQSVKILMCVCLCFGSRFCDLWRVIPGLGGVRLAPLRLRKCLEVSRFSLTLMTLMKEWKEGLAGWAKRH